MSSQTTLRAMLLCIAIAGPAGAMDFSVNSASGAIDAQPGDGVCATLTPGECTLTAAIEEANALPGPDRVVFAPGLPLDAEGFARIEPTTALVVTDTLEIDGTTAPGFDPAPEIPQPVVHLDGAIAPAGADGLRFTAGSDGSAVLSLAIVGFPADGIHVGGGTGFTFQGLHVGIDGGARIAGNGGDGIEQGQVAADLIVGATFDPMLGFVGSGNVIAGNGSAGIRQLGDGISIAGNRIGTSPSGRESQLEAVATGNASHGVYLAPLGSRPVELGLVRTLASGETATLGNVVSANGSGVYVSNSTVVAGNAIGTSIDGDAGDGGLGNRNAGIEASDVAVLDLLDNVISGNGGDGLTHGIHPGGVVNAIGNRVGVTRDGSDLGNGGAGLELRSGLLEGNWIGGNEGPGLVVGLSGFGAAPPLEIRGNWIGTDEGGADLGNGGPGVDVVQGFDLRVGGAEPGSGNVIGFNGADGVLVREEALGTVVQGNWIGTDAFGRDLRNDGAGVVASPSTRVGGALPGEGNVIGFNQLGVEIGGGGFGLLSDAVVAGNWIGTDPLGRDLGNRGPGVDLPTNPLSFSAPREAQVGARADTPASEVAAHGNAIHFNDGPGIAVGASLAPSPAIDNALRGNSFRGNAGLRIDLHAPGPNQNDAGDTDGGTNQGMNYPVLGPDDAVFDRASRVLTVEYRLDTVGPLPVVVDFYGAAEGERGDVWLGSDDFGAFDLGKIVTLDLAVPAGIHVPGALLATATDVNGNTSEYTPTASPIQKVGSGGVRCGLGAECAFVVPLLAWARRRLRRRTPRVADA